MATSKNSSVTLIARGNIRPNTIAVGGGRGGVSNYELLTHKPSINGHELVGNKTNADLGIPTDTQDLTNTAGFITKIVDDLVNYYTKLEIDDIINQIKQTSFRIVDDLPLVGDPGVIYLILNSTPQSRNYYDEYIYVDNRWEKIGTTEIDLSGYVTDEELTQVLRNYITNETLNETLRNYYNKADINLLLAGKANSADLAAVATSGSYDDLQNKPVIPNKLADLAEDATHRTVTDSEKETWNNKSDFSGSYEDLTNKPDIPDELADLSEDSTHRVVTDTEKETWSNKSDFSGSYNDLTDKPDIPTVYNSTITIKKNNQNIDSFTLNQSSNKSINMDVPEKTSDIQNDSGFITNTVNNLANYYLKSETYTKTEVSNLINAAVSGRFQKVNALPAQGEANVIYLVPKATVLVDNIYDEYIWEDGSWELIGDTQIDLSGYVTDADLTAALQNYVTSAAFNATISNYYTKTEVGNLLADKVDKIDGKGLSTYDYDVAAKTIVDSVTANLATKVDKVDGKGLSTNDYTTADKNKLAGIAANATKVESSETNGNIKIDTVETVVYDDSTIQNLVDTSLTETEYANPLSLTTDNAQNAVDTKIKIEPIQDLHGFDKPWVGGAGKNVFDGDVELGTIDSNGDNVSSNNRCRSKNHISVLPNTTYIFSVNGTATNVNWVLYDNTKTKIDGGGGGTGFTAPNNCYYVRWFYDLTLYQQTNYQLEVGSSPTSYEPYANICPISGHDQINVLGCGKNLWNNTQIWTSVKITFDNGVYKVNSNTNACSINCTPESLGTMPISLKVGEEYRITYESENAVVSNVYSCCLYYDGTWRNFNSLTFIPTKPVVSIGLAFYGTFTTSTVFKNIQLSLSSNSTTFEPYTESNNKTIVLLDTVYGGELDLESGELVVDREYKVLTGNDVTWYDETREHILFENLTLTSLNRSGIHISNLYVNRTLTQWTELKNGEFAFHPTLDTIIRVMDSKITSKSEAETYFTSNPLQVCYELATPTTIQLTPHQLSLLKSQNNLTTSQYTQIKVVYRNGVFATLEPVSEDNDGLMSRLDKVKLDSIADDATKTESSTTNGNIKINGTETQIYDDSEIKGELTTDTTTIAGNPLNFTTLSAQKSKSTIIDLEPIQDLHGYDYPWVGGAGKNLLPMTVDGIKAANTGGTWSGNVYNYNGVDWTILTDSDNNVIGIKANGSANPESQLYIARNFTLSAEMTVNGSYQTSCMCECKVGSTYYSDIGSYPHNPPSGTAEYLRCLVRNNTSASNYVLYPMLRLSAETDSTFAPWKNECPISGRTEVNLDGCGKNICSGIENGTWISSQVKESRPARARTTELIKVNSSTQYCINAQKNGDKNIQIIVHYYSGLGTDKFISETSWESVPYVFTTPNNANYLDIIFKTEDGVAYPENYMSEVQLEKGNQATTYEPYQESNNLTISFGQTVYGGQVDVEKGLLVIKDKCRTLTGTDTPNALSTTYKGSIIYNSRSVFSDANFSKAIKTNMLKFVGYDTSQDFKYGTCIAYSNISFNLWIKDGAFADNTEVANLLDSLMLQVCYELATPITINLTPNTINLLKGVNNISTDGDKITLTYRDGSVATLGDLTSAVDELDEKIDESKILTDTATGDKYILVVTNGVLSVEQINE